MGMDVPFLRCHPNPESVCKNLSEISCIQGHERTLSSMSTRTLRVCAQNLSVFLCCLNALGLDAPFLWCHRSPACLRKSIQSYTRKQASLAAESVIQLQVRLCALFPEQGRLQLVAPTYQKRNRLTPKSWWRLIFSICKARVTPGCLCPAAPGLGPSGALWLCPPTPCPLSLVLAARCGHAFLLLALFPLLVGALFTLELGSFFCAGSLRRRTHPCLWARECECIYYIMFIINFHHADAPCRHRQT